LSAISQQDFDSLKTALLSYYNSQTTAHAAYIIALAVGLFAVLYQQNFVGFFTKNNWLRRVLILYLPISVILSAIVFFIFRIIFWAWMSSAVLGVTFNEAVGITTIAGMQNYLVGKFESGSHISLTSLFYSLDQHVLFGISFLILFAIWFLLILGLDFAYVHRVTYVPRMRIDRWHNFWIVMVIIIIILLVFVIYPRSFFFFLNHL